MSRAPDQEVVERDWARFRALARTENHWDREGWWPGRRAFYWYLRFGHDDAVRALAAACQDRVGGAAFDLVPLDDLHLTLCRVGFADDLTPVQVRRAAEAGARVCRRLPPFRLAIGPLAGSAGAVRFTVTPWEPVVALREALAAATGEADGRPFRPHVGIAYSNRRGPIGPVVLAVSALRDLPPVTSLVAGASLVALERRERAYACEPVVTVALGG